MSYARNLFFRIYITYAGILAQLNMVRHRLFASEPIGNLFYLHAVIFETPKQYFIIKPPACWGADVLIEIYELLLLFSIITPCFNTRVLISHRYPK